MPDPLRVPLSALKVNPGGYLESARQRRVLLTRRGKVVGELVPLDARGGRAAPAAARRRRRPDPPRPGARPDRAGRGRLGRWRDERRPARHLRHPLAGGGPRAARGRDRLIEAARADDAALVSPISAWEIAQKEKKRPGSLGLAAPPLAVFERLAGQPGVRLAPLTPAILVASVALDRLGTDDPGRPDDRGDEPRARRPPRHRRRPDAGFRGRRDRLRPPDRPAEPGSEPAARAHQPERDELARCPRSAGSGPRRRTRPRLRGSARTRGRRRNARRARPPRRPSPRARRRA